MAVQPIEVPTGGTLPALFDLDRSAIHVAHLATFHEVGGQRGRQAMLVGLLLGVQQSQVGVLTVAQLRDATRLNDLLI